MFLSERTVIHMQWHKDGERENKEVMVHPSDSDVCKALDNFDLEFAQDAINVGIGLATDGFTPFGDNTTSYSYWPVFVVPYNLPFSLCMKYEFMFLYLIIPCPDHPGPKLNVIQSLLKTREMLALVWRLMASHLLVIMQHRTPAGLCLVFHTIFLLLFA
jgi:hypothetical protein